MKFIISTEAVGRRISAPSCVVGSEIYIKHVHKLGLCAHMSAEILLATAKQS